MFLFGLKSHIFILEELSDQLGFNSKLDLCLPHLCLLSQNSHFPTHLATFTSSSNSQSFSQKQSTYIVFVIAFKDIITSPICRSVMTHAEIQRTEGDYLSLFSPENYY